MTETLDLTTATPVEIDTALSEIYTRYYEVRAQRDRASKFIIDLREGLAKFAAGDRKYSSYSQRSLDQQIERFVECDKQADEIMAESFPYEAEYRRRPWTRFFLVKNSGGHIHSSMSCSTCFPTTQFGWLPDLSGQSEPEAVAAHGAILCTVCYPSAPVEWTDRRDDSLCAGSGTYFNNELPHRFGYYSGNYGTCEHCGERITVSKTGKLRKHKKD